MARKQEFEHSIISAKELQVGDRLSPSGTIRIHGVMTSPNSGKVIVGHKTRGSHTGGAQIYHPEDQVKVWRKK